MLQERARKAVVRYLEFSGYSVLDDDYDGFVIYLDADDDVHFVDIVIGEAFAGTNKSREDFEQVMCKWLANNSNEYINKVICPDVCSLKVIGGNRALIRHEVNVQELM